MQIDLAEFDELFAPWAGGELFCGYSGGADSTAALLITAAAAERFGFTVEAVHINHHLRGAQSDGEAAEAEAFCRKRGIAFQKFDLAYEAGETPSENTLREKRLAIWRELVRGKAKAAVVLGHHADDAAENLLLKWGRGGNVSSLTAPGVTSHPGGLAALRPLLGWSRAEIEEFLKKNGVSVWAVDSSNLQKNHCLRNQLRLDILPRLYALHPGFREGVRQSLAALRADAECLERFAEEKAAAWLKKFPDGIPAKLWANEMPAIRFRLLKILTGSTELTAASVAEFDRFLAQRISPETRRFMVPGGKTAMLKEGRVHFVTEPRPEEVRWLWRNSPGILCGNWRFTAVLTEAPEKAKTPLGAALFDAETLPDELLIAPLAAGEKMVPFGRDKAESVKKLRVDRKIAAFEAPPAVRTTDGIILWAPKIRHGAHFPAKEGRAAVKIELSHHS